MFSFILERCLIWEEHVNQVYFLIYVFYSYSFICTLNLSSWKIISSYPSNAYQKEASKLQCILSSQSRTASSEQSMVIAVS